MTCDRRYALQFEYVYVTRSSGQSRATFTNKSEKQIFETSCQYAADGQSFEILPGMHATVQEFQSTDAIPSCISL